MPTHQTPDESFEQLLAWLAPDREQSGEKYEQLRGNLLNYFRRRGALDPPSLADEVIARVTKRVDEIVKGFVGDPAAYFFAVARKVLAESWRRPIEAELPKDIAFLPDLEAGERKELLLESLERCWARLKRHEQEVLYRYCVEEPPLSLCETREQLAHELGQSLNALRVMMYRMKKKLKRCIEKLVERSLK